MWHRYIEKFDPFYKSYGSKKSPGITQSHRGQKVIFTKVVELVYTKQLGHEGPAYTLTWDRLAMLYWVKK